MLSSCAFRESQRADHLCPICNSDQKQGPVQGKQGRPAGNWGTTSTLAARWSIARGEEIGCSWTSGPAELEQVM